MIIVTGGAGFIGSNLVKGLNERGCTDVLVVDDLTDGTKFRNIVDCEISDYLDKDDFLARVERRDNFGGSVEALFHQGACSKTTEWDGRYMMKVNYEYTKTLFHYCQERDIPFIYASSASVYGAGPHYIEEPRYEAPLNVYGYSKYLFDQYLRHFFHQIRETGRVRLFEGSDGYGPGEQRRDFIHVDDVVALNLWFFDHPDRSGIFNAGTGKARTFNDVARAVIAWNGGGEIEYIPFPAHLVGRYQSFTEADLTRLRAAGYDREFISIEEGVPRYMEELAKRS